MRIFLNKYCNFQAKTDDCKGDMPFKATSCRITYLCRKDLQGNIIALIDNNGNTVVEYKYDAWGNHKVVDANGNEITSSNHLGNLNPFRYRGYYYDVETGLYFLKSRYYDPEVGRFLNMDAIQYADPESVNGLNLYAYCGDNPVMGYDPEGTWSWSGFWNVIAAVAVVVVVTAAVALTAGAAAVAVGASTAVATAVTVGAAVGGTVVGGIEIANQIEENGAENINVGEVATKTLMGAVTGARMGMSVGKFIAAGGIAALSGGALALAGGGTVSVGSASAVAGILGLSILFSKISKHGTPNSTVANGTSEGIYDENGNLIYRRDFYGKPHYIEGYGYTLPHTHGYKWKFIKGAWRIIKKFVLPF